MVMLEASDDGVVNERVWLDHLVEQLGCVAHEGECGTVGDEVANGEVVLV